MSRSFHEGNFEEVAVYSGLPFGHKYQFFAISGQFQHVPKKFRDQKITRQITARAGAFSENALLNSDVWPAAGSDYSDLDVAGVVIFGPDDSHQLNNFHRRTSL